MYYAHLHLQLIYCQAGWCLGSLMTQTPSERWASGVPLQMAVPPSLLQFGRRLVPQVENPIRVALDVAKNAKCMANECQRESNLQNHLRSKYSRSKIFALALAQNPHAQPPQPPWAYITTLAHIANQCKTQPQCSNTTIRGSPSIHNDVCQHAQRGADLQPTRHTLLFAY